MGAFITVKLSLANSCPPAVLLSQRGDDRLSFTEVKEQAVQFHYSPLRLFAARMFSLKPHHSDTENKDEFFSVSLL